MRALYKEIKDWKYGFLKYLKYSYRMTFWLYLNRWRRFAAFTSKHFGLIRRASFPIAGITIGLLVDHYSGVNFTQDILSNYLVSAGAMTGGTIAIVFTISIFLIEKVADLYSSQYFEIYIHDWKEKFVYFIVILITIVLLGGGLYVGGLPAISAKISSTVVVSSLFLIGLVFALIDWQYKNVRAKLSPAQAILFLENEGINFLKKLQYDAEKMAGIIQASDESVSNEIALATAYNRFLQPFITNLDRQLENLVEISMKLADKQEIATTKRGLTGVHNLLAKFFEARKTSSLALPSGFAFLAIESDSQKFLTNNFERLNKAGEKLINEGKDEIATFIIDIYNSLAVRAKKINFISRQNENPILELIDSYLNFYIGFGERAKNIEVVYQGSRVLGNIAEIAAEKGLEAPLHGLQKKLMEIAVFGLGLKQTVIVDNCTVTFLRIIGAVFKSTKIVRRHHFDDSLKNIATIAYYISFLIKSGGLPNDITTRFSLSKGYDEFYTLLVGIVNHYSELTDVREKDNYRGDLIELFHELNMSLRKLSEDVKDCDSTLADSIGRLLFYVNNLIIDFFSWDDFKKDSSDLTTRLSWNIHLPYWFVHHAEKFDAGSMHLYTLTDSVAKTGILIAEKLQDKKLMTSCIDCLYSITKESLKKSTGGYGYDEPRILEKACYLGILALKKGWDDVFIDLALKIYKFEPQFYAKYLTNLPTGIDPKNHNVIGLPHHDQLLRELWRWRDDYERESMNGLLRIRDDAEAMMYEIIEPIDIDRFIFEVWETFIADGEFEAELNLKSARKKLVNVLKNLKK